MKHDILEYRLEKFQIRTLEDYKKFQKTTIDSYSKHIQEIDKRKPEIEMEFVVEGYSYTANSIVKFECDYKYSLGFPVVNWRERLTCPLTHLNNRARAAIHIVDTFFNIKNDTNIYIMEQTTPIFNFIKKKYNYVIGSEYLGDSVPFGSVNKNGIRNEDATCLTFDKNSLDLILSFDVFEHIPNYKLAFLECFRVLRDGGHMFFSVPFAILSEENIIRATIDKDGLVSHILPPIYHGDPMNSEEGVLCYHDFGWAMLTDLLEAGFSDAYALIYWSTDFGYFGSQIQFIVKK